MLLREKIVTCSECSYNAIVTADYSNYIFTFEMQCIMDREGSMTFCVTQPSTISGITGTVTYESGAITFDEQILAFDTLGNGQIAPVIAPWIFLNALRSGYIRSCTEEDEYLKITIDDSYHDESIGVDIWIDENDVPIYCDILWNGCRILSLNLADFLLM